MNITPINSNRDYQYATKRIGELMDAAADTDEGAGLDVLATPVDVYESRHMPVHAPDSTADLSGFISGFIRRFIRTPMIYQDTHN